MSEPMKSSFENDHGAGKGAMPKSVSEAGQRLDDDLQSASQKVSRAAGDLKQATSAGAARLSDDSTASTLKEQASEAAREAKTTVAAMADEARTRIAEIIDQQKNAGADQVAGVAKAAQAAAGDLQQTSPQLAKLVRTAAESVDHVAGDIRASTLTDILGSLSEFGRRQPVAMFGGAVLAGFLLSRFLKSDAPAEVARMGGREPHRV